MRIFTLRRGAIVAGLAAIAVAWEPAVSARAPAPPGPSPVTQWTAEVVVSADCDGMVDGSRIIVHNRIATSYTFTRRVAEAPVTKWAGKARTTYRWAVGTEFRESRDAEEGSGSFEADAELQLT